MNIPTLAAASDAASESVIRCKEPIKSSIQFGSISNNIFGNNVAMTKGTLVTKEVPEINAQLNEPSEHDIAIKGNSSVIINSLGEASDCHRIELKNADIVANKSPIQIGSLSNFVEHEDNKKDGNIIVTKIKKSVEIMAKLRTALFQGSENDEPMTIQNIHAENFVIGSNMATCISYVSPIQFGAFICDGKYRKKDDLFTATGLLSKIYFGDATLFKRKDNMPSRRYFYTCSTLDEMKGSPT